MPDLRLEKRHLAAGNGSVIGIDEAGRGPWAQKAGARRGRSD